MPGDVVGDPDQAFWRSTPTGIKQVMALSMVFLATMQGHLTSQPLFSHLPGLAVFCVGMLAGALAVVVSSHLRAYAPVSLTQLPSAEEPVAPAAEERVEPSPPQVRAPAQRTQDEPTSGLRIGMLGPLTINGQAGALVPAQSQLIVALALHRDGLPNRRLRALLGPDAAHPRPPDSLRQLIARTRRALGRAPDDREWIEHLGGGVYCLHPKARVDWREFEMLTDEGTAAADPVPLTRALALVRGEPFTQCYYWWLEPSLAESVSARIVAAAEALAGLNLAGGEPAAAVRAARVGLTADPSAEQLWRLVMRAEHAAGNLAGVREAMGRCMTVVAEVAADGQPATATLAVYGQLLAR